MRVTGNGACLFNDVGKDVVCHVVAYLSWKLQELNFPQKLLNIVVKVANGTPVTEFILVGFSSSPALLTVCFTLFLLIYLLTVFFNSLIIVITKLDCNLHTPMYFFLSNFAFLEIWYTTTTMPTFLSGFLTMRRSISHQGCITQLCFFFCFGPTEFFLLAVMALDRYVAICNPLRYSAIMSQTVCIRLAGGSWVGGFVTGWALTAPITRLNFCADNQINHFFCDFAPLISLACSDKALSEITFFTLSHSVVLSSLLLTTVSYVNIGRTIVRIPSSSGRQKAFSTCASHLTVVSIFYGTVIFMYLRPTSRYSFHMDKLMSVFYCVITPFLNPLIYSLRNKDVRAALQKALRKLR
ncbi:olfactory receptor 5P80-like [Ambystoma mexicanum]|uniref:olfactory receptor 5P80-like n=1 Tax=Ambystoma mexicanum TaxID=8296 RepID=UPI0037E73A2C